MENLFFSFANIGFSTFKPKDLNNNGITKNLKQATEEMGLPGKPKKHLLLLNFANMIGFPGLIATPLK